jgi:hypothetical protein
MDEIISKLKTPEECIQFANKCAALAREAQRRAIELRANAQNAKSGVETELWKALFAYEEILSDKNKKKTLANRTRPMIKSYGIIGAAEKVVNRSIEAKGYKVLVEKGLQDMTFEAVIVRFPEAFAKGIVKLCQERLEELNKIK